MSQEKIRLTGSSHWFNVEKAIQFEENIYWDGKNRIPRTTRSQWEHERLLYTRYGNWILDSWSQWEGSPCTTKKITVQEAADWIIAQDAIDTDSFNRLPKSTKELIHQREIELEV